MEYRPDVTDPDAIDRAFKTALLRAIDAAQKQYNQVVLKTKGTRYEDSVSQPAYSTGIFSTCLRRELVYLHNASHNQEQLQSYFARISQPINWEGIGIPRVGRWGLDDSITLKGKNPKVWVINYQRLVNMCMGEDMIPQGVNKEPDPFEVLELLLAEADVDLTQQSHLVAEARQVNYETTTKIKEVLK